MKAQSQIPPILLKGGTSSLLLREYYGVHQQKALEEA